LYSISNISGFYRQIIIVAVLAAILIFLIRFFEVQFFTGQISTKLYITLIGIIFLAIGGYIGIKMKQAKTIVQVVEVERQPVVTINSNDVLTDREADILSHIIMGHSNKEMAEKLFISENTVKKHINNIYSKLGVKRRSQAIAKAKELGLFS
jgi:two-component system, NarL family, response regulator LiaR